MSQLVIDNLSKEFPTRNEPLRVLQGVSLEVRAGENLAVLGPSGSGKSTLLHILGTLDEPTAGQVLLKDQNPFLLEEQELAHFRREHIGLIFQDHYLLPQCTTLENVLVPTLALGGSTPELRDRAISLLKRVGLGSRLEHRPAELSGGERQRAATARALLFNPTLLLADEPTGNLDRTTAHSVTDLLLELASEQNMIFIAVTHSLDLAERMAQRYKIDAGQLQKTS